MKKRVISTAFVLCFVSVALAADGFTVHVDYSGWDGNYSGWEGNPYDNYTPQAATYVNTLTGPLKLYRYDIVSNAVVNKDTICDDPSAYPAISIAGDKVVFYRKDESNNWHISMVNKDGTGLDDLADVASNVNAVLDWPSGDWVYYAKSSKPVEFWKVNVETKQKEKVWEPTVITDTWRFTMTADGQATAIRAFDGYHSDAFNCFPPKNECRASATGDSYNRFDGDYRISRCNIQVSPSGAHLFTYIQGQHYYASVHNWDRTTDVNEVSFNTMD